MFSCSRASSVGDIGREHPLSGAVLPDAATRNPYWTPRDIPEISRRVFASMHNTAVSSSEAGVRPRRRESWVCRVCVMRCTGVYSGNAIYSSRLRVGLPSG